VDQTTVEEPPAKASLLIPATLGAVFFMEGLDSTIIATSLPQIGRSMHVGATSMGVAMTAYFVSVSMWIGASGWLADRFESKRVFVFAISIFLLGSIICGVSNGLPMMIAGRFVQGAGGALMMPIGRLILARSFPRDELVHAMSFMIIPGMAGPMLGPVIGGWITTYLSWRWIFFVNVPLGFVGVALAMRHLRSHRGAGNAPFDGVGFVIVAVALIAMQSGLELLAASKGVSAAGMLSLVAAAAAFGLYGLHARRPAPILDLRMFRFRGFAVAVIGGFFARIALGSTLLVFPLLFQLGLSRSAIASGVLMGLLALGQIVVRPAMTPILATAGVRPTLFGAGLGLALLMFGLLVFDAGSPLWLLGLYMLVFGFVQSVLLSTLAALSLSGMPNETLGAATSISAVVQRLAPATGIALTSILLAAGPSGMAVALSSLRLPIVVLSLILVIGALIFLALQPQDGSDLLKPGRGGSRKAAA